jgi:hypothetical protein
VFDTTGSLPDTLEGLLLASPCENVDASVAAWTNMTAADEGEAAPKANTAAATASPPSNREFCMTTPCDGKRRLEW